MITAKIEKYDSMNKYYEKGLSKEFASLQDLEDWIFAHATEDCLGMQMSFCVNPKTGLLWEEPNRIMFPADGNGGMVWIHQIKDDMQTMFSDGTQGEKCWSTPIQEWLQHCYHRQYQC